MLSKSNFIQTYLTSSGLWPDNVIGTITPEALRSGIYELFAGDTSYWYLDSSGILASDTNGIQGVDFDITLSDPPYKEGRVFYDNLNHTFAVYLDQEDVTLQIGQESYIRIINQGDDVIPNGTVVEIVSAGNALPHVQPALSRVTPTENNVIGFATHNIQPSGAQGFVTIQGMVHDINTSAFSVGDALYLSPTISGAVTNVKPNAPYQAIRLGYVVVDHASLGRILTRIDSPGCLEDLCNVDGTVPQSGYILVHQGNYWDPSNNVNPSGGFLVGDVSAGNYSEFQHGTGFKRSYGDARSWDDLRAPFTGAKLDVSAGRIDYNFDDNTVDFADNATDSDVVNLILQMQHDWAQGTDVHPHLHWIQNQDEDPAWTMDYRVYGNGDTIPSWTTGVTPSEARKFTYSTGSILQITEFPTISGVTELSGFCVSWFMDVKIYRVGASDSYSGDASSKEFDLHYIRNDTGSRSEYIK